MIELTTSETQRIKELAQDDKLINKLYQLYESYQADPTLRYFLAYKKAIFEISSQLEKNANQFQITDNKDDKGFERTMKYMIESQKLIENLKYLEKQITLDDEDNDNEQKVKPISPQTVSQKEVGDFGVFLKQTNETAKPTE